ncbi:MAG: hypothetical protein M3468_01690 [Acidobacteriota bacterium]|nr:hypothetical protein [Acidobacteriota bacterium]
MKALVKALMFVALPAIVLGQSPVPVGSVTLSSPTTIAEIDLKKLKGEPSRLAWSPDGKEMYLQTIEGLFQAPKAVRHYVITAADGKVSDVKAEPAWFGIYWSTKSNKASPDAPGTEIALASENRVEKTTSAPVGGDLARGGTVGTEGTTAGDAIAAAANSQAVTVHMMKLHGQTIGEFVNSVIVPGLTFAWAPKGSKAIAYAEPKGGRIVLMDPNGKRQALDGTKDALLPMWSHDATQLAWLQKDGKRKFHLKVAKVN